MVINLPRGRRRCRARGSDLSLHQTESLILPSNDLIISNYQGRLFLIVEGADYSNSFSFFSEKGPELIMDITDYYGDSFQK